VRIVLVELMVFSVHRVPQKHVTTLPWEIAEHKK